MNLLIATCQPTSRTELEDVAALAGELGIWVVLGSAHPLTPPHWPHNSLYVISDNGKLVDRYDKRKCSNTELTRFYTPGFEPVVFERRRLPVRRGHLHRDQLSGPLRRIRPAWGRLLVAVGIPG